MRNGRHDRLPVTELAQFRGELEREARLKGLAVSITTTDNGDGTVAVEWTVAPGAAAREVPRAAVPAAPAAAPAAAPIPAPPLAALAEPDWLRVARDELGEKEVPGTGSNPRIVEYHGWTGGGPQPDGVPWCGAFVAFCLGQAGMVAKGKGSARAADWLSFGDALPAPRPGCIVVLRPQAPGASGHVGFWVKEDAGFIHLLGGNQSDAVTVQRFPLGELRSNGYRWPRGAPAAKAASPAATTAPSPGPVLVASGPGLSDNDLDVMVRTLWGEARGEPETGQVAVVHVIRNRAIHRRTDAATECQRRAQFSCWSDAQRPNLLALRTDDPLYVALAKVARMAWETADITDGARHYYAPRGMPGGVPPDWAASGLETLRIGGHVFLKNVP
jgi:uncharacterized protein (TIGR02594 family)